MPKKPRKPVLPVQLSIDATPETARLDQLLSAKHALMAKDEADQRHAVSVKEAIKLLDISRARLNELLAAGLIGSFKDGESRKIIVHSIHIYQIRLVDLAIDVEVERMDRLGIPGTEEWLNSIR